ncbi:HAD family hydrolase [Streptomyces sp. N50]|nr:HAD family hydrolase [Streptomyces sp. N50]WOX15833.1 HAD family hydrolase [Streptomyces sp. N50]
MAVPTRDALAKAVAAGWTCVIVTNGRVAQQELKIRRTGLDAIVHGWVISESVGRKKPAPEIFHAAATKAGASLHSSWVVGDSAHADIRGAAGIGVRSVWVSNGRAWTEPVFRPTHIAVDAASAIHHVIGAPVTAH